MVDRRLLPILAICIPFLAAAALAHVLLPTTAWMGGFEWFVLLGLAGLAIVTVVATCARVRWLGIAVPVVLLVAHAIVVIATLFRLHLIPMQGFASDKYAVALAAGVLLAIGGLVMRRQWARWLALALGATGIGCGTLNAIHGWDLGPIEAGEWRHELCRIVFFHIVCVTGGALILVNLVATRGAFVASAAWDRPDAVVRWLRLAMIASFVAVPMLLVYAWLQPVVPATANTALVLAAALAAGATLAIRGKVIGALVLVAAGFGLLAQTLATLALAAEPRLAAYYAVFWAPAALIAIVCGVLLARPTLRLLRG